MQEHMLNILIECINQNGDYSMKELTNIEIKNRTLLLLDYIIEVCKKNNLTFYLGYGSALGAVRHSGFIPWDDDLDIMMPRKDYKQFIEICNSNNQNVRVYTPENTPSYIHYFAKVVDTSTKIVNHYMEEIDDMGVFVDVFPMDEVIVSDEELGKTRKAIERCIKMLKLSGMKKYWPSENLLKSAIKYLLYCYAKAKGVIFWQRKLSNIIRKISTMDGKQYLYGWSIVNKDIIKPCQWILFENRQVPVPGNVDAYLKELYGDYMQLPPKEKQVTVHDYIAYEKYTSRKD